MDPFQLELEEAILDSCITLVEYSQAATLRHHKPKSIMLLC